MVIKVNSYRADAKVFETEAASNEVVLEFDLSEADYITSDGFAAIIRLKQQGKVVKLLNANEHIRETVELIKLEGVL